MGESMVVSESDMKLAHDCIAGSGTWEERVGRAIAEARQAGRMEERIRIADWMHDAHDIQDCNPRRVAEYIERGDHRG